MLVPRGKIALGKLAQALVHGAKLLQVDGNFDDCLETGPQARRRLPGRPGQLGEPGPPAKARRRRRSRSSRRSGDAPDVHCLPVGNAGNITAYWMGYREYAKAGKATRTPRMFGFQASGAAPIVRGEPVLAPVDDRDRDQDRQPGLLAAGRGGAGTSRAG